MQKRILLSRADIFKVLAVTNIEITSPGSLWVEAMASEDDLLALKNSSYKYTII
jgi:hypothetical protein